MKNLPIYEETLKDIETDYAWGNDLTMEVLAKQYYLAIEVWSTLNCEHIQKVGTGDKEIELLLLQDGTTPIYELNGQPKRDSNGAVIMVGGHYWAVVPIDSQVGRPSESGGS